MSATPFTRQPLATALAAALLTLGVTGAVWAGSTANPGADAPRGSEAARTTTR